MVEPDEEETSLNLNNKLLVEAITAKMEKIMDSQLDALRQELHQKKNRVRKRREQELNPKPPDKTSRSTLSSLQKTSHTPKSKVYFNSDLVPSNKPQLFTFSGKRNYLEWETNMDDWLYYHRILKKERLAFAISQLAGDAHKWWLQEVDDRWYHKEPTITSWEYLKELLRKKYAPNGLVPKEAYSPQSKKVPKHVLNEKMEAKATSQPKKAPEQVIVDKQSINPSLEKIGEPKKCHTKEHENDKAEGTTLTRSLTMNQTEQVKRCNDMPSHSKLIACFPANKESEGVTNTVLTKEKPADAPSPIKNREHEASIQTTPLDEQSNPKETNDGKIFSHHRSQAQNHFEVYLYQLRLKYKESIGKYSNFLKKAGEFKQYLFLKQPILLCDYIEALTSLTNLAPVLPSENMFLLHDYEDEFSEDKLIRLPPIHEASQNHIWRPGDYLGRPRTVQPEIWITSLHMFSDELKKDLSSFSSSQAYQWRPGEFSLCTKEEPPDLEVLSFRFFVRTGIGVNLIQEKKPLAYFRMVFEVGEKVSVKKKIHPTPKTDGPVMINKKIIGDYTYLRGKYKENSLFKVAYSPPPFIADDPDLRTNHFQEGGDDMNLSSKEEEEELKADHGAAKTMEMPTGPITSAKAKQLNQLVARMMKQNQEEDSPVHNALVSIQACEEV